ncbi:Ribonuclease H-like domain containing protein [Fagus crenata]
MAMNLNHVPVQNIVHTENGVLVHCRTWIPPSDDSWKLSFAGCTPGSALFKAGVGIVVRDQNAIFKTAFAAPIRNFGNQTVTELTALNLGLDLALKQGVDFIEIEGDYSPVINILTSEDVVPSSFPSSVRTLVVECGDLLNKFRSVLVRQVHFQANESANTLAVVGCELDESFQWINKPPQVIAESLILDVIGRWMPLAGP